MKLLKNKLTNQIAIHAPGKIVSRRLVVACRCYLSVPINCRLCDKNNGIALPNIPFYTLTVICIDFDVYERRKYIIIFNIELKPLSYESFDLQKMHFNV